MAADADRQSFYARISLIIAASTIVLTFSFIGILAVVRGDVGGMSDRLPWYLVSGALAFVATIVLLEGHGATGREIIVSSTITAFWSFVLIALAIEGISFTIRNPEEVFVTRHVLYFLAAALLGTGISYWALHHWREFTGRAPQRL